MERVMIRLLARPSLRSPLMVVGLPGVGGIGDYVTQFLASTLDAVFFAELISPMLPDYVIVENGLCRLPRLAFHAVQKVEPNLVLVSGDAYPPREDVKAYYELCEEVVRFAKRLGVRDVISVGGFLASTRTRKGVYVAYTSEDLGRRFLSAGARKMQSGRIVGPAGLIPAMAAEAGMRAACLLSAVSSPFEDREASLSVLKVLLAALGLGIRPLS